MLKDLFSYGLNRRQMLLASGGLATSAAIAGCSDGTSLSPPPLAGTQIPDLSRFNPFDKKDNLETFIKMSGSLDETEDSMGWYSARIFSVIGDYKIIQPLFDVEGFGMSRHEKQADGSYLRLSLIHISEPTRPY